MRCPRAIKLLVPAVVMVLCLFGSGCKTVPETPVRTIARESTLLEAIISLDTLIDETEASRLAAAAVRESLRLSDQYSAVRPPWVHNVMVNYGFRERGLCFHWTNDLFLQLHELNAKSVELHLAVARMDTRKEHNAIVLTGRGKPFHSGIVLDAWRTSGKIYFGPVAADKYPWVPLPPERFDTEIKKRLAQDSGI